MKALSIILLSIALVLEISITTLPLIFMILLCLTVVYKDSFIFVLAFIFGILFDLAVLKPVGMTSAYFIIFLFLVTLYQRKFEIATYYFVLGSAFLGSLGFLLLLNYNGPIFTESAVAAAFGLILFTFLKRVGRIG